MLRQFFTDFDYSKKFNHPKWTKLPFGLKHTLLTEELWIDYYLRRILLTGKAFQKMKAL